MTDDPGSLGWDLRQLNHRIGTVIDALPILGLEGPSLLLALWAERRRMLKRAADLAAEPSMDGPVESDADVYDPIDSVADEWSG